MPKILLIDDNPSILNLMKDSLLDQGVDVDTADDGEQGSRMLQDGDYAVLVTDIFMPQRDGLELIREIRQTRKNLKILVITGGGGDYRTDYLKISKLLGADALLSKPFDPDVFAETVGKLLQKTLVE